MQIKSLILYWNIVANLTKYDMLLTRNYVNNTNTDLIQASLFRLILFNKIFEELFPLKNIMKRFLENGYLAKILKNMKHLTGI